MTQAKNTICLWYDGDAEEAARFYAEVFPNSEVTAVQPLDYAQLWTQRIVGAPRDRRIGVSVADSNDYLLRVAARSGAGLVTRVCSVAERNSLAAVRRMIDSSAVDGVAIGLSRRSRLSRCLTGEFSEWVLGRLKKPYLLTTAL